MAEVDPEDVALALTSIIINIVGELASSGAEADLALERIANRLLNQASAAQPSPLGKLLFATAQQLIKTEDV